MKNLAIMIALTLAVACASSQKQKVVTAHSAVETAFGAVQDNEIALYKSGAIPQLTPEKHIAVQSALKQIFATQDAAGAAIQSWQSGQPVPAGVTQWLTAVEAGLTNLQTVMPPSDSKYAALWATITSYAKRVIEVARLLHVVIGNATLQISQLHGGA